MKHVVIIGGGISGLAAAHRLLERAGKIGTEVQVTLIEAGSRVGGIVQTRPRGGFLLEHGPDSFISEKPAALELAGRLGLESHLIETNDNFRRSFVVRQGRLMPIPEGFHLLAPARLQPFLKSEIISWAGKARMALDLILPRRSLNGSNDPGDESLAQFVRRRFGQEALERIAQPMVGGIYTADPERLSLRATMPRFLEWEREHRSLILALRKQDQKAIGGQRNQGTSGARYSLFLSFARGMQVLTDKLEERILNFNLGKSGPAQTSILLNTRVKTLTREREGAKVEEKWKIQTNQDGEIFADAVCLALPSYVSANLLRSVDNQLASELQDIKYASSATINLAYKRDDIPHALDGFGFVVPLVEKRTLMACTFSSVKFAGRAPQGQALLRAFVGGALQPEALALSDDEMVSAVRGDLQSLLGIERAPGFAEVARWERSMPQYHVGHLDRVKRIEQRLAALPNLALAGNAYSGLGIPDCVRSGEAAAEVLLGVGSPESGVND